MLACTGIIRPREVMIWIKISVLSSETLSESVGDEGLLHMLQENINER